MKKLGLKRAPILLVALGLLGSCAPAFAGGHWNVTYESSGDCYGNDYSCWFNHGETYYDGDVRSHPWIDGNPISHNVFVDGNSDEDYGYDPLMAHIGGSVTAVFSWVPDSNTPNEPPPAKLSVREELLMNAPAQYLSPTHNTSVKGYNGTGLTQISNSGGNSVIRLPVRNLNIDAYSAYQWDGLGFNLYLNYFAHPDTRSLKLTRGGRYECSQLQEGEWHTYGDSIYSAHSDTRPDNDFSNHISIGANYDGNWNTYLTVTGTKYNVTPTWSSSGFAPTPATNESYCYGDALFGTPTVVRHILPGANSNVYYDYYGPATGPSTHVTSLSAKDNVDGATATAYYQLTLHDPVELISSDEGQANTLETYTILSAMTDASGEALAYSGYRPSSAPEITVKYESSTEDGLELTATVDVDVYKELLGLSAEASAKSTISMSVGTTITVPPISGGKLKYLIAVHHFQRQHLRFYRYDEQGKLKRFITQDSTGGTYNLPVETYHEAIHDSPFQLQTRWSDEKPVTGFNINNIPDIVENPPSDYDFSGDTS